MMRKTISFSIVAIFALAACFSERGVTDTGELDCTADLNDQVPGSTIVVINNFAFGPNEVRVSRGTRVTWVQCDGGTVHTSTSDNGAWNSGDLATGATFTRTFDAVGTFPYHCQPHPNMRASIIVE
jgi:plastocyanin